MLEHGLERTRIAGAQEVEETARESRSPGTSPTRRTSNSVRSSVDSRQPPSSDSPAAGAQLPEAPRRVEHVEVRDAVERQLHPMEHPPRLHHRHVERLAVVGDDQIHALEKLCDRGKQRPFGGMAGEQELADLERAEIEEAQPTRNATVPAPPLRPVVSRSMNTVRESVRDARRSGTSSSPASGRPRISSAGSSTARPSPIRSSQSLMRIRRASDRTRSADRRPGTGRTPCWQRCRPSTSLTRSRSSVRFVPAASGS